jgi:DNA-binding CsgD family transcriptional regulator/predicted negative regulator of RcsB-dependent stress response
MEARRSRTATSPRLRVVRGSGAAGAAAETEAAATHAAAGALAAGRAALLGYRWEEARRAFGEVVAAADLPEAHEGLAAAASFLSDGIAGRRHREAAFRGYRQRGDVRSAARVATRLGAESADHWDEPAVGRGWLQRGERLLEGLGPTPELAWLRVWQAHVALVVDDDLAAASRLAGEAAELGGRLGLVDVETLAQAQKGMALVLLGRPTEGFALLDEAATAACAGDIGDSEAAGASTCYVLHACEYVLDYERVFQWLRRAEQVLRQSDHTAALAFCREHFCRAQVWRGEWQEAERDLARMAGDFGAFSPGYAASARRQLAEIRYRKGLHDEALALISDDASAAGHALRAAILLAQGRPAQAIELAERALRRLGEGERLRRGPALAVLARSRARRGDLEEARLASGELDRIAAAAGTTGMTALSRAVAGDVAAAAGDLAAAREAYEDATDLYGRSGAQFEAAASRVALAECLAVAGRAEEAAEEARRAVETFRRLDAPTRAAAVELRLLAPAPTPEAPAAGDGRLAGLSERERQVLAEVARGRSNQEIADRLYLSVHTVKRHVANLLGKLELPSRTAAAALAVGCGLGGPRDVDAG